MRTIEEAVAELRKDIHSDVYLGKKTIGTYLDEILEIHNAEKTGWIPVSERLPETDSENSINNYNVLLWVKNKSHPERKPQIFLGKLRHIDGDDGSGNFWGIETKPCDWTIWGWCYLSEPEVIAWMPLPEPYKAEKVERGDKK